MFIPKQLEELGDLARAAVEISFHRITKSTIIDLVMRWGFKVFWIGGW